MPRSHYFSWILEAAIVLLNQLYLSNQEPDWKMKQTTHSVKNYTTGELQKFCGATDLNRIIKHLDQIAVPRPVGSANHKKVALYIRFFLEELGYRAEFFTFKEDTVDGPKNFTNIVATKYPTAHRRLVLACHYDSKQFSEFPFIGATDSALPCSLMLDVAQSLNPYMKDRPNNDISLQLMFFDGEEAFQQWSASDSLYGSRYMADLLASQLYPPTSFFRTTELDRIDALILLDLLGAANPQICNYPSINDPKLYAIFPETENQLSQISDCLRPIGETFGSCDRFLRIQDDHIPFQYYGVKIVHVIPGEFPRVWHKQSDNREALDGQTIENLSVILRVFVARYLDL